MESHDDQFDVAVIGTGLQQSIAAAALARSGLRVLHLDQQDYYGSANASLNVDELVHWAITAESTSHRRYSSVVLRFPSSPDPLTAPSALLHGSRHYSISLSPALILSQGKLIESLISSGVSQYGGFRLLEKLFICDHYASNSAPRIVPSSKEEIFKSKDLSLVSKRKLMKLLEFAVGQYQFSDIWLAYKKETFIHFAEIVFKLPQDVSRAILFAIAHASDPLELVHSALPRLRRYMLSTGRYGDSPFLMGHYGGLGEIAQGFCRACAVHGGTYILGHKIQPITPLPDSKSNVPNYFRITVDGISQPFEAKSILCTAESLLGPVEEATLRTKYARAVVILSGPYDLGKFMTTRAPTNSTPSILSPALDTVLLIFPPCTPARTEYGDVPLTCLITGSGTMSCPKGQTVIYMISPLPQECHTPELLLRPYLDELLSFDEHAAPLLELFYTESVWLAESAPSPRGVALVRDAPPSLAPIIETGDNETKESERLFWEVSSFLATEHGYVLPQLMWDHNRKLVDAEEEGL